MMDVHNVREGFSLIVDDRSKQTRKDCLMPIFYEILTRRVRNFSNWEHFLEIKCTSESISNFSSLVSAGDNLQRQRLAQMSLAFKERMRVVMETLVLSQEHTLHHGYGVCEWTQPQCLQKVGRQFFIRRPFKYDRRWKRRYICVG